MTFSPKENCKFRRYGVLRIRKASDIDDLYERVKNYDLVLTVEAPLADALNNRLEEPKLGEFAITPKKLAYGANQNRDIADERGLFIEVVRRTGLSWKQAFYTLENVLSCWKNTGDVRKILDYERFDISATRQVLEVLEETPNVYGEMEDFEPEEDGKTAVIAPYQFDELDREVLPEDYDPVEVFEDEEQDLPEFKVFGTATDVVQAIRENVDRGNAEDIAIVVSPESGYTPLLQSLFRSENIPFMSGRDFAEDENLRTILFILKSGLSRRRLRLRDVQPILRSLGVNVSVEHNLEFLADLEIEELDEIKDLLSEVEESTFGEMVEKYGEMTGKDVEEIRKRFDELGVSEDRITEESVNRFEYYLDSFDIQVGGLLERIGGRR